MTAHEGEGGERLVKSAERVRDLGEVFTPAATVQAMLDLLPDDVWNPHPSATFLEPAAGDGNFLVAILERKLARIARSYEVGRLPAGDGQDAIVFHALEAVASIYAVDISPDNIIGGTPGHELGARQRLVDMFCGWHDDIFGSRLDRRSVVVRSVAWIIDRNVLVGNMLPSLPDGSPSGRDEIPLVEYLWDPSNLNVTVRRTTMGAVMADAATEVSGVQTLSFDEPEPSWTGPALGIRGAPVPAPCVPDVPERNGKAR